MKKTLGLALCLLALFFLTACTGASTGPQATGTSIPETTRATVPETVQAPTQPPETTTPATEPQPTEPDRDPVSVRAITYAELDALESTHRYEDSTEEFSMEILVSTTSRVTKFRYLEVSFDGEDYRIVDTLYSSGALEPGTPFSVTVSFPGLFPNRAISFVDSTGAVRYYALTLSGEDGSVRMEEFTQ